MEFRILGPIEVVDDGRLIDIGPRQQRAVLAILLLNANAVVSTDRILEDLWPDDPIGKERTLWVYISRLRTRLRARHDEGAGDSGNDMDQVLVTHDHGYSLRVDPAALDAYRFAELAKEGRHLLDAEPEEAGDVFRQALNMWRGDALEDFAYDDFVRVDVARLQDLRIAVTEDRIEADLRIGRHREVVDELQTLVATYPARERFVQQQMIALYRSGRQAEALRAFEQYRLALADQSGLEPSPELRRVEEQVLLHDPRLVPSTAGSPDPTDTTNPFKGLHAFTEEDADRFFGRDRLIGELIQKVEDGRRLLVVIGASGSGKSSALHAGLVPRFRKGEISGSENWTIATMVPGARPFEQLEVALVDAALESMPDGPTRISEQLTAPKDGVLKACRRLTREPGDRILLVIDQFEELFTLIPSRAERRRFVDNLEVAIEDPSGCVVVVLGLRADFYGRPLEYPRFARMMTEGIVNVVTLTLDELESAAEEPAARAGVALEPSMLVELLGDVAGQPGGLPLFQYALTELFDGRDGTILTHGDYIEMGRVSGAIARRAEDLYLALTDAESDARQAAVPPAGDRG